MKRKKRSGYRDESGWEWGRIRAAKLAANQRDNAGRCERGDYGCLGDATEVHHVVARVVVGGVTQGRLEALCSVCHYHATVELIQQRAKERREAAREAKRKNRPGRKDRYV